MDNSNDARPELRLGYIIRLGPPLTHYYCRPSLLLPHPPIKFLFVRRRHLSSPMPDMSAIANPQQRQFNPYAENGGTILAIAGADFTVIAGDTRQSEGYSIQTRYAPKVFRLSVQNIILVGFSAPPADASFPRTDRAVLAVNGFAADGNMFVKKVKQRLEVHSL